MPNRLIKDSIHTSDTVNQMTDFQFRLWVNLITYVDDYGRGDARPAVIRGACFPLRERLTNKDIETALNALAGIGCVCLYEVDGRPYLYFPTWESHQRIRQKVSKFPAPENGGELRRVAADCGKMPRIAESRGLNPIQYESNTNTNSNTNPNIDNNNNRARARDNPFSDEYAPADPDPVVGYAARVLVGMSPNNVEELVSFRDSLPDDVIIHAIDETAANGTRNYSYTRKILNEYVRRGFKSIGDINTYEDKRKGGTASGGDQKSAESDDDLWAGFTPEQIAEVERLANDGYHYG